MNKDKLPQEQPNQSQEQAHVRSIEEIVDSLPSEILKKIFAEKAQHDGTYAVAYALMELGDDIADALSSISQELGEFRHRSRRQDPPI